MNKLQIWNALISDDAYKAFRSKYDKNNVITDDNSAENEAFEKMLELEENPDSKVDKFSRFRLFDFLKEELKLKEVSKYAQELALTAEAPQNKFMMITSELQFSTIRFERKDNVNINMNVSQDIRTENEDVKWYLLPLSYCDNFDVNSKGQIVHSHDASLDQPEDRKQMIGGMVMSQYGCHFIQIEQSEPNEQGYRTFSFDANWPDGAIHEDNQVKWAPTNSQIEWFPTHSSTELIISSTAEEAERNRQQDLLERALEKSIAKFVNKPNTKKNRKKIKRLLSAKVEDFINI